MAIMPGHGARDAVQSCNSGTPSRIEIQKSNQRAATDAKLYAKPWASGHNEGRAGHFDRLRPTVDYLSRLQKRMDKRGFPDDDCLLLLVCDAQKALQSLCMEIHYLSCDGVGRPRKGD